MSTIRILGIDPSLTSTGYSVVDVDLKTFKIDRVISIGTIKTEPDKGKKIRASSDALARSRHIVRALRSVIEEHDIKLAVSEVPSGGQSAKAVYAFGIVVGILASLPIPVIEVSQREVKMASVGVGYADKEDMVRWAVKLTAEHNVEWPISKRENEWAIPHAGGFVTKGAEHMADSIAAVSAGAKSEQFRQLAGMMFSLI